jgi:hypothetical protein
MFDGFQQLLVSHCLLRKKDQFCIRTYLMQRRPPSDDTFRKLPFYTLFHCPLRYCDQKSLSGGAGHWNFQRPFGKAETLRGQFKGEGAIDTFEKPRRLLGSPNRIVMSGGGCAVI